MFQTGIFFSGLEKEGNRYQSFIDCTNKQLLDITENNNDIDKN